MRIAVVHSYYSAKQPSGENIAVDAQVQALREAGHDVRLVDQRTDIRQLRRAYPLKAALGVATGRGPDPTNELTAFAPDVVHVHNLFPNWSTRWLSAWQGPLVATLHNYRPLCAAGTLMRDGRECTLCPDGQPLSAVKYHCYHDSRIATVPLALRNRSGPEGDAVTSRADALIVMAQRANDIFQRYGAPSDRLHIIPNFVEDAVDRAESQPNGRWLFVGRLSAEKGLLELLERWPSDQPLDVVGDGELAVRVRSMLPPNGRALGLLSRDALLKRLPTYAGLVFPSRWPESAVPLVVIEAMAAGVPVVALRGNTAADLIERSGGGVVVNDNGWTQALRTLPGERDARSQEARALFEADFTAAAWLQRVTALYQSLL